MTKIALTRSFHNQTGNRTYRSWRAMRERCLNPENHNYKNYGGRGITIAESWLSFEVFFRDMGKRPKGKTLDRIDVNGPYCKSNCRWATTKEQCNNTRYNVLLTLNGETMNIQQWCDRLGMIHNTLLSRINAGWTHKDALTRPHRYRFNKRK